MNDIMHRNLALVIALDILALQHLIKALPQLLHPPRAGQISILSLSLPSTTHPPTPPLSN